MKKYILITGASGGIGREISIQLAKSGYSLYLHYHKNQQAIKELLEILHETNSSGEYIPIQANLFTEEGCVKLCQEVYQIDGIIHNSGIAISKLLTTMQEEEIRELLMIHLNAPIIITKNLLPKLIQKHSGSILFISSVWGQSGGSLETVYSAAKGGQIAFAKALSKEVALSNIRVNVIAPGVIQTNMLSHLDSNDLESLREEIPLGRLGTGKDVANTVNFLLSDESSYITGQVIGVNGGWYM